MATPYDKLQSLFQPHPDGPQFGFVPIKKNPHNGQDLPIFQPATSPEDHQRRLLEMPAHLRQQIEKMQEIQRQQIALARDPTYVPGPLPKTTAHPLDPSADQRTDRVADRAGLKKTKPTPPKYDHQFRTQKFSVHLKPAYGKRDENGVYSTHKLSKEVWIRIEQIYKKYLDKLDYPEGYLRLEDMFFYMSVESGDRYFQVTYSKEGYIEKQTILVESDDLEEIRSLKSQYNLLVRAEPKQRDFKRLLYSSKGLQENLHFPPRPIGPSESPFLTLIHEEAVEKAKKQAKSYMASVSHPRLPDELSEAQQHELLSRPITLGHSSVEFVEESHWVDSMTDSQYFFSESPHQVRSFYGVAPRSGNHAADLRHPQATLLAKTQPLHYWLNARAGSLFKEQSIGLQEHPSLVVFSKHETLGYRFASITQQKLLVPRLDGTNDENCGAIMHAIIEQASKYHEVRLGFKETPGKPIKIREPIIAEGIRLGDLDEEKLREIRLSVFIRSMAILLVNSNKRFRAPEVQLEFEYSSHDQEKLPEFVIGLANQQNRLFGLVGMKECDRLDPSLYTMKDLIDLFYSKMLDQFPDFEEMEAERDEFAALVDPHGRGSSSSSRASSRSHLRRSLDSPPSALSPFSIASDEAVFNETDLGDADL